IPAIFRVHQTASGVLFTKAENVAVRILDVKIEACPRSFFKRLDHLSPTHFQLAEQTSDARHGNVRVQMFVLFPVFSVRGQFRRMLEMDCESVTADARVERLILKIELEAKLVTVVRNRSVKIIDEKLRGYPGKVRSTMNCNCGHLIPQPVIGSPACRWSLPCFVGRARRRIQNIPGSAGALACVLRIDLSL